MPTTPWSQPGMTSPAPSVNLNGSFRLQDASNSAPVLNATPTYWTDTLSPSLAALPLPLTMSRASSFVGGEPDGLGISGFTFRSFEIFPAAVGVDGCAGFVSVAVVVGEGAGFEAELRESFGSLPHAVSARAVRTAAVRAVTFLVIDRCMVGKPPC